jgi:glutaredoxin
LSTAVEIDVVSKEGCLPCLRVKRIVKDLEGEIPGIVVREVDFSSQEGIAIAVREGILYPPAVMINGTLFGAGKILEEPLKEAVRKAARGD